NRPPRRPLTLPVRETPEGPHDCARPDFRDERVPPAHPLHGARRTISPPSGSRITCLGFITALSRQTHRTARNHGGNGMLVDHLADGVLQQDDELVEGFDLPLQLDAVDQIDGYRNTFLAQDVQVRVL